MIATSNRTLQRAGLLFELHANQTITLPAAIVKNLEGVQALSVPSPGEPVALVDLLTDDLIRIATDGLPLPTLADTAKRLAESNAREIQEQARNEARTTIEDRIAGQLGAMADEIITDHLRPAHDALVADISSAVKALGENDLDPALLLAAPPKVRDARITLEHLAERYQILRRAHEITSALSPSSLDHNGQFLEIANATDYWRPKLLSHTPPWPSDPIERVVWFVRNDAQLWCPTGVQRDAAYLAAYPTAPASQRALERVQTEQLRTA